MGIYLLLPTALVDSAQWFRGALFASTARRRMCVDPGAPAWQDFLQPRLAGRRFHALARTRIGSLHDSGGGHWSVSLARVVVMRDRRAGVADDGMS
jgi:hypothetical protein